MARKTAPGEMVAVDSSSGMLSIAVERARAERVSLTPVCADAEQVIRSSVREFDVVSLRFGLAYLDWHAVLPYLERLVRPAGRVAILTSLLGSARQAYAVYCAMADELGMERIEPDMPASSQVVAAALASGGLTVTHVWEYPLRLWFETGAHAIQWLQETGYVAHSAVTELPAAVKREITNELGRRLDAMAEPGGVPLDFDIAGVIAQK
jgi:hypothetical protein